LLLVLIIHLGPGSWSWCRWSELRGRRALLWMEQRRRAPSSSVVKELGVARAGLGEVRWVPRLRARKPCDCGRQK
jgi:hypothetical protein